VPHKLPARPATFRQSAPSHLAFAPIVLTTMQVRYFNECQWADVSDGLIYQFIDADGETLAEVALKDSDGQLWKFEVMLPDRYKLDNVNPGGIVASQASARRIAELILLSTIVNR
jgi:hypothetical protein